MDPIFSAIIFTVYCVFQFETANAIKLALEKGEFYTNADLLRLTSHHFADLRELVWEIDANVIFDMDTFDIFLGIISHVQTRGVNALFSVDVSHNQASYLARVRKVFPWFEETCRKEEFTDDILVIMDPRDYDEFIKTVTRHTGHLPNRQVFTSIMRELKNCR